MVDRTPEQGAVCCIDCGQEFNPCEHCGALGECPGCWWDAHPPLPTPPPCCEGDARWRDELAARDPAIARAWGYL